MIALYDSGWPILCPRSAEVIGALLDHPRLTTAQLAEIAAAQTPQRWSSAEQWLASNIWDGIRPPDLALPALGAAPDLDEHPAIQVLRQHLTDGHHAWERWNAGFAGLVEACNNPPVDTMAELLAFWQDIGILVSSDNGSDELLWSLHPSLPSPWQTLYARGRLVQPTVLASALDYLLDTSVPLDPALPPRELFNVIIASRQGEQQDEERTAVASS
jgi:hypothetical protein